MVDLQQVWQPAGLRPPGRFPAWPLSPPAKNALNPCPIFLFFFYVCVLFFCTGFGIFVVCFAGVWMAFSGVGSGNTNALFVCCSHGLPTSY